MRLFLSFSDIYFNQGMKIASITMTGAGSVAVQKNLEVQVRDPDSCISLFISLLMGSLDFEDGLRIRRIPLS